jgi:hypothetical protein
MLNAVGNIHGCNSNQPYRDLTDTKVQSNKTCRTSIFFCLHMGAIKMIDFSVCDDNLVHLPSPNVNKKLKFAQICDD